MRMAYSVELRLKALSAYEAGMGSQTKVAGIFGIGVSTFKRWVQKKRKGDSLKPSTIGLGRPKKINSQGIETIKELIKQNPSITLNELSKGYYKKHKVTVSLSMLCRELKYLNLRYKKLSIQSEEKHSEKNKKKEKSIC
jgi:transposase